jgi:fumarate reductase subunit D
MRNVPPESLSWGEVLDHSDSTMVPPPVRRTRSHGPKHRLEAMAWAMFSAGGFVAAVLIPVHVAILGIAWATGWLPDRAMSYDRILHLVHNPLTKLYLLALISLPLFHWAHRFRFAIHHQFGIELRRLVALGCYGTAILGTGLAVWVLLQV